MKGTFAAVAALLVVGATASLARAQHPGYPQPFCRPAPHAPDFYGPGRYYPNCCGTYWGPVYCVRPPWEPFNGARPGFLGSAVNFGTHPYARSPRDYFMIGDNWYDFGR